MNMKLLETCRRAAKIETFILGFSYSSFQNVVRVLPSFSGWLRRLFVDSVPCLKKPLGSDRTLLEHGFLPGCKRSCTRFLQMGPAPGFTRS